MKTTLITLFCLCLPLMGADKPLTKEESTKVIEAEIRKAAKKPQGQLTEEDYKIIVGLKFFNQGITDVSSLSRLIWLEKLNLMENRITDISSLSHLKNLTKLNVGQNSLKDLSPLVGLVQLEELWTGNYGTKDRFKVPLDLMPLKGLVKLEKLQIVGSHIKDLSPVCDLPEITFLELAYSRIDDYQPLLKLKKLKCLQLEGNITEKDNELIFTFDFWVGSIAVCCVAIPGLLMNLTAICVLLTRISIQNIFNHLLISLFVFDSIFLVINIAEVFHSQFGMVTTVSKVYMILFPHFIWPLTGISLTASIFMTVGIAHERYVAIKWPIIHRQSMESAKFRHIKLAKYMMSTTVAAILYNIPLFFEAELKW